MTSNKKNTNKRVEKYTDLAPLYRFKTASSVNMGIPRQDEKGYNPIAYTYTASFTMSPEHLSHNSPRNSCIIMQLGSFRAGSQQQVSLGGGQAPSNRLS